MNGRMVEPSGVAFRFFFRRDFELWVQNQVLFFRCGELIQFSVYPSIVWGAIRFSGMVVILLRFLISSRKLCEKSDESRFSFQRMCLTYWYSICVRVVTARSNLFPFPINFIQIAVTPKHFRERAKASLPNFGHVPFSHFDARLSFSRGRETRRDKRFFEWLASLHIRHSNLSLFTIPIARYQTSGKIAHISFHSRWHLFLPSLVMPPHLIRTMWNPGKLTWMSHPVFIIHLQSNFGDGKKATKDICFCPVIQNRRISPHHHAFLPALSFGISSSNKLRFTI